MRRDDIQLLRGISVIGVVLFHTNTFFSSGYLGVNVFFTISGYVTGRQVLKVIQSNDIFEFSRQFRYFLWRRFRRLFPAFSSIALITIFCVSILGPVSDAKLNSIQLISGYFLSANFVAYRFSHDYFSPIPSAFIHLWSLSAEEQIYIFCPILLFLLYKIHKSKWIILVSLLLVSFCGWLLLELDKRILELFGITDGPALNYYLPTSYLWQYLSGLTVFILHQRNQKTLQNSIHQSTKIQQKISALSFLTLVIIIFAGSTITIPRLIAWIITSTLTVIILWGSLNQLQFVRLQLLSRIGDASYSIYLLHMPILYLVNHSPVLVDLSSWVWDIFIFFGIIGVGIVVSRLFEFRLSPRLGDPPRRLLQNASDLKFFSMITFISLSLCVFMYGPGSSYLLNRQEPKRGWLISPTMFHNSSNLGENVLDGQIRREIVGTAQKRVLLIGDSHGGSLASSLVGNNNLEVTLFLKSGCFFTNLAHHHFCDNFVGDALSLASNGHYDAIIVSNRFQKNRNLRSDFVNSIKQLAMSSNSKVIVVGPFPELPKSIRVGGTFWQEFGEKKPIRKSLTAFYLRETDDYLNKVLKTFELGIEYISVYGSLCTNNSCKIWNSTSGWLFLDYHHLSESGAETLMPRINQILFKQR